MDAEAQRPAMATAAAWAPVGPRVSVGTLLGRTFGLWKRHAVPFMVAAFVLELPSTFLSFATAAAEARGGTVRSLAGVLPATLAYLLLAGMLTSGVLDSLAGRPVRLSAMLSTGVRRFGRVFAVSFLTGLVTGLAALLLVVPGLMVASALWVAIPAALAEPDDSRSPVERSRALTKGHRLTIFLTFAILIAMNLASAIAVTAVAQIFTDHAGLAAWIGALLGTALAALATGLWASAPAVAFHDLRALKEGADPSTLEKVFE